MEVEGSLESKVFINRGINRPLSLRRNPERDAHVTPSSSLVPGAFSSVSVSSGTLTSSLDPLLGY